MNRAGTAFRFTIRLVDLVGRVVAGKFLSAGCIGDFSEDNGIGPKPQVLRRVGYDDADDVRFLVAAVAGDGVVRGEPRRRR